MGVLNSGVINYTNVAFETDEIVLFIEVSSIQRCPDREVHIDMTLVVLPHILYWTILMCSCIYQWLSIGSYYHCVLIPRWEEV